MITKHALIKYIVIKLTHINFSHKKCNGFLYEKKVLLIKIKKQPRARRAFLQQNCHP